MSALAGLALERVLLPARNIRPVSVGVTDGITVILAVLLVPWVAQSRSLELSVSSSVKYKRVIPPSLPPSLTGCCGHSLVPVWRCRPCAVGEALHSTAACQVSIWRCCAEVALWVTAGSYLGTETVTEQPGGLINS